MSGQEDDSSGAAVPLRLLGGLHRLVLDGRASALRRWYPRTGGSWDADRAWPEITVVADEHADALRAALGHPPQINEVGRSAALIGALLRLNHETRLPIRLVEIGCSAGLNLRAYQYHYRFDGGQWGPTASPVTIDDAWHDQLSPPGDVRIVARHGYDIAPTGRRDQRRHRIRPGAAAGGTALPGRGGCARGHRLVRRRVRAPPSSVTRSS